MDTSLNFVTLVETNPITRLTHTYNNKFVNKIKETFTETQQQLFVSSLYCFLNHHPTNDYVIDLDNIWKWLGFSQKDAAKRVLEKHFVPDKDYKCLLHKLAEQKKEGRGGHNKETILVNIQTFKLMCIKADTKKSHEIHEYFIKLEQLLQNIVLEESNELKLQLEQVNQQLVQTEKNSETRIQLERQNMLLREYGSNINVVYIIKVKQYENGEYVIKIGESRRGVEGRFSEHKTKYENPILLDCFAVKKCKDFERFLHTHDSIRSHMVKDLPGHENETELFRIGRGLTYQTLQRIVQSNLHRFNELDEKYFEEMVLSAMEKIQVQTHPTVQMSWIQDILTTQQDIMRQMQILEQSNRQLLEKVNTLQTRTTTGFQLPLSTLGERLQRIHPETLTVDKVYESVTECLREYNYRIKRPSIHKAVEQNTIYHGFRWALIGRDQEPNTVIDVEPTRPTRIQQVGYIAQLNPEKTEIYHVYLDRKVAARENGYTSHSGLDTPVKNGTVTKGHIYMLYEKCDEHLRQYFEHNHNHGNPVLLYVDGVGQYNTQQQLVREFKCKYDCCKELGMSDKTINRALEKNISYHDFYYRRLGKKDWI